VQLNPTLLTPFHDDAPFPPDLRSCLNDHGRYSTVQFVLRLSRKVHRLVEETPAGIYTGRELSPDHVQAFSTYLHETIHWWQHIGSTAGFMLSLSHPVQSHANYTHLRQLLDEAGPKKSVLTFSNGVSGESKAANRIVNNFLDIEFFKVIATRPDLMRQVADNPSFECVGHSYQIMYGNTLALLGTLFDRERAFLPDPRRWEPEFDKLRTEKKADYYYGSPIVAPTLGLREILEGQARFSQLQYLFFASGEAFSWDDARNGKMLDPPYVSAFECFLRLTNTPWPERMNSPEVGLFLAVCDVALNPGEGFPFPIMSPATFIFDNDPGTRFIAICHVVAMKRPDLLQCVKHYTREEYAYVTDAIAGLLLTPSPMLMAELVSRWAEVHDSLKALMEEDRSFRFSPENMPVRLLFARYIHFCRDKFQRPEVFCWPGAWFAGPNVSTVIQDLFVRHHALYMDKAVTTESSRSCFRAKTTP
jgi:hypothetical protein